MTIEELSEEDSDSGDATTQSPVNIRLLCCGAECRLKFDGLLHSPFTNSGEWTMHNQSTTLKFMNACVVDGNTFDLQVVIPAGYRARPGDSRVQGGMYKLNMAGGNNVSMMQAQGRWSAA